MTTRAHEQEAGGIFKWGAAEVMVQPLGSWNLPCWMQDNECRDRLEAYPVSFPENVTGYHWFASSWG